MSEIEELNKAIDDMGKFYIALRGLLLDLKALNDPKINILLEKYEVKVQ